MSGKTSAQIPTGLGTVRAMGDMGVRAVPVAMTMAGARRAHAAGLTMPMGATMPGSHRARGWAAAGPLSVVIDTRDMRRIADAMTASGRSISSGFGRLAMAVNRGMMRFQTGTKRKLQGWTGMRTSGKIGGQFKVKPATAGSPTAVLSIRDKHHAIDGQFGAAWSRGNPGATHKAWNRPQIAVGSFMAPGKAPIFRRTTSARLPIAPIWGPNMAREVERHRAEVQADLTMVVRTFVIPEAVRLMGVSLGKGRG